MIAQKLCSGAEAALPATPQTYNFLEMDPHAVKEFVPPSHTYRYLQVTQLVSAPSFSFALPLLLLRGVAKQFLAGGDSKKKGV